MEQEWTKEQPIQVEKEWDKFIKSKGGQKIADIVGESPSFENADYLIENVVIELKEVFTEFSETSWFLKDFESLVAELMQREPSWIPSLLGGQNTPDWFEKRLIKLFRKPIGRIIKKANSQIKSTKKHLNISQSEGILLFVNDHFTTLPPYFFISLVADIMLQSYSSINCVIYLNVNSCVEIKESDLANRLWVPMYGDSATDSLVDFVDNLGAEWILNLHTELGAPHKENLGKIEDSEILLGSKYIK